MDAGGPGPARLAGGRDGGVGGEADGGAAADDVVGLRAVGVDPGPLRRRVLLEERGGGRGCRCGRGVEEEAAEHGIRPGQLRDGDQDVATDRVVEVDPRLEGRDRLGGQHGAGRRAGELHLLASPLLVPIEEVELQVVLLAVGEVDVHGEAGGGKPGGGDAAGAVGDLQSAGIRGAVGPGPGRLAGGRDGGVAGDADGGAAADDVVALRAVGVDPGPLRRRVLLEERGRGGGCRCGRWVEEQAAEDGIGPGLLREGDQDVAADRVVEVDPRLEGRDRLGGQHGAGNSRARGVIFTCSLRPCLSQSRK